MAQLGVPGHGIQAGMQIIARGGVEIRLPDLAVHLVTQLGQERAGLGLHFQLEVNKPVQVGLDILLHDAFQRFSLDVIGYDNPFAVQYRDLPHLGDAEPGLLDARLVECLVQYVRLGIAFIKDLQAGVSVAVDGLVVSDCNNTIQFHASFHFPALR